MEPDAAAAAPPPQPPAAEGNGAVAGDKRKREEEEAAGGGDEAPEAKKNHPLWKTSLCSFYRRGAGAGAGRCSHGDSCRFAHGEAELRPRPDNTWDPTSERAKKLLKSDGDANTRSFPAPEEVTVDEAALDKCLIGLPRKWSADKLKSFLDEQGISYSTAKKKKGMTVGFVTFDNVEQLKNAIEVLHENTCGGKEIKIADATRRSHEKKHTTGIVSDDGVATEKDNAVSEEASTAEGLVSNKRGARDVVTPLAHMPYNDQLEHKKNSLAQTLKRLTRNARKACPDAVPLPEWIVNSREIGGLPCKLEGIIESPTINGYRNKCEFSVGYSLDGKKTVGFMLGNFREGITAVEEPVDCPNVSGISCKYALIFQDFLRSSSLPVWDRIDNTGFWRQFTVREGRNPGQAVAQNPESILEAMVIVQVCSTDVDEALMKDEFDKLRTALVQGAAACSPPLPLTTVVVQDHKGISNAAPADCPLIPLLPKVEGQSCSENQTMDKARIHDYISNLCFSISPTAFFQVNTLAAERLYTLAGDWADLNPETLLFDVCCGTGTIGLTLAHRVGTVVGIEMNESAVSDAQRNAVINGVKNCRFVCAKAEDVMGPLLTEYLGAPQQDSVVSKSKLEINGGDKNDNGTDGTEKNGNVTDGTEKNGNVTENSNNGEIHHNGLCSSDGNLTCASAGEMLATSEDMANNKLEGGHDECNEEDIDNQNTSEGPLVHEDSTEDATASPNALQSCTDTSRATTQDITECNKTCQDDSISDTKGAQASCVCQFKNVVAIVDPPRVGLHPTVIKALRTHPCIRRLVYISCNPDSLVANAIELCTPTADKPEKCKGNRGWRKMSNAGLARYRAKSMPNSEPFHPVRAMAVDLFPHTMHCEMVMLFER